LRIAELISHNVTLMTIDVARSSGTKTHEKLAGTALS